MSLAWAGKIIFSPIISYLNFSDFLMGKKRYLGAAFREFILGGFLGMKLIR